MSSPVGVAPESSDRMSGKPSFVPMVVIISFRGVEGRGSVSKGK